jgi:hypothetical protein
VEMGPNSHAEDQNASVLSRRRVIPVELIQVNECNLGTGYYIEAESHRDQLHWIFDA